MKQRAQRKHAHCAEAIRERAGKRLTNAPEQHLDRERERKDIAAPSIGLRHRREEETE